LEDSGFESKSKIKSNVLEIFTSDEENGSKENVEKLENCENYDLIEEEFGYSLRKKLYDTVDFNEVKCRIEKDKNKKKVTFDDENESEVKSKSKSLRGLFKKFKEVETQTAIEKVNLNEKCTQTLEDADENEIDLGSDDERNIIQMAVASTNCDLYRYQNGVDSIYTKIYRNNEEDLTASHTGCANKRKWQKILQRMDTDNKWSSDKEFCKQLRARINRANRGFNFLLACKEKDIHRLKVEVYDLTKRINDLELNDRVEE